MDMSTLADRLSSTHFGPENALVANLFDAVEQGTAHQWMPLIVYGDSGCGKSFTVQSLSDRWSATNDGTPVVTTAADLVRLFQPSQLASELSAVNQKYRTAPLLTVDDVDQLPKESPACSWLAHVLDDRLRFGLPSIVTAKSVATLGSLPRPLLSRLMGGLPVRCALPGESTRRSTILSTLNASESLPSGQLDTMVRQSAGLSITAVRNLVRANSGHTVERVANDSSEIPNRCIAAVARRLGIRVADIRGTSRRKNAVLARSIAMLLIRQFTPLSLVETGRCFHNRDHTTVRHACEKIKRQMATNASLQDVVRSVCASLNLSYPSLWSAVRERCA